MQLSPTLAVKYKSQAAVLGSEAFMTTEARGPPLSARNINEQTFTRVLNSVGSAQRIKYLHEGQQLIFADRMVQSAPEWVDTPMNLSMDDKGQACLSSPVCSTPVDMLPKKFAGMWYAKLLTPAQAYEWIVFDAFKI